MTPQFGFNRDDRLLLRAFVSAAQPGVESDSAAAAEQEGDWCFVFTTQPTPRVDWSFDNANAPEAEGNDGPNVLLRCRPPDGELIDLRTTKIHRGPGVTCSVSGRLPSYEPSSKIDVTEVRFDVLNWGDILGTADTRCEESSGWSLNRHQWSSDGWEVTIDGDPRLSEQWRNAEADRAFTVTHCGRLSRADRQPFAFRDAHDILRCLHWFLSFVRGRRVGIALAAGFADDPGPQPQRDPIITHWGVTPVDEAASAQSWYTLGMEHELDRLFRAIHSIWRADEASTHELRTMISTYCVAQDQSIPIDMRILAGYIGLETQRRKNLNLQKLQAVLHEHNLPHRIKDKIRRPKKKFDGPETLVDVRNRIVHHKPCYPDTDELWRAWDTCLYYLELLILRKLGHEGHFCDRFRATARGMKYDMPHSRNDASTSQSLGSGSSTR
ncbi:hypothetical protein [Candidatus Poriferisodalis sp.]|uniref:hypothetical protein n=1 Tax=Candidatus Poriferisodalis sp. TaxID=3101277 RepID=UPI003C6F8B4E